MHLWKRLDRSHLLDDRTHAELVWMAFQSRYGVRWTVVSGDLPMVALLAIHSHAISWWLVALVATTSTLRIGLAETYARWGHRGQARAIQRRWETSYLLVGVAYSLTLSVIAGTAIETGDGWLVAWVLAGVTGFSYGIIGYVANRPAIAYGMTASAVGGTILFFLQSSQAFASWLALALAVAYLGIRSLIERHYNAALAAIADRHTIERIAETDHLTGLANRRHLETVVRQALKEAMPNLHWLGIDLDRFKAVNDTFGHEAGDEVLRAVASRTIAAAGEDALVARIGGDEFVVLLIGDRDRARRLAGSISDALAKPIVVPQGVARIGASVGATAICAHDTIDEIARRADERMYRRKAETKRAA